ncbi:MAG: YcnI family protein [Gemmatimonadaceae bacterium]
MSIRTAPPRRPRTVHRALAVAWLVCAAGALLPSVANAHVTVWPRSAARGAFERYVVRVPNERNVPSTRVEIHFPAEVRISSFQEVAGWQLEVLTDSAGKITGAVWTGSLPAKRFVEFPFIGVNPKEGERIVFPATQAYEGGEVVQWSGPEGSKTPASVTTLTERPAAGSGAAGSGGSSAPLYISLAALTLGVVSLGLSLRRI